MNAQGFPWRAIVWIERFLPTPVSLPLDGERLAAARRRAAFVLPLIFAVIVLPGLLRERHRFGGIWLLDLAWLEQVLLVVAGCVVIAAIGFGVKAWRETGKVG